ncbi:type II toxin-antitoxin system antitoxin SocA domain-containing protein [Comamonas sp. MYb21]|uniref:Panacea domain-containing protein n=1 Tax=Comamonas sp. MYb21 TaxID=1848648 RepID=UPI0030B7A609
MAYSAFAVANAFIERAEQGRIPSLTPMKLQKLLYFAQAWHLKGTSGAPFLDDNFARWQHGPVIPALYHEFKAYGYRTITRKATTLAFDGDDFSVNVPMIPSSDVSAWGLVDAIINRYGSIDAQVLSNMTHLEKSAWASGGGGDGSVITHGEILTDPTIK